VIHKIYSFYFSYILLVFLSVPSLRIFIYFSLILDFLTEFTLNLFLIKVLIYMIIYECICDKYCHMSRIRKNVRLGKTGTFQVQTLAEIFFTIKFFTIFKMPVALYLTINIICDIFNLVSVLGLHLKFDSNRCAIRIAKFKIYM